MSLCLHVALVLFGQDFHTFLKVLQQSAQKCDHFELIHILWCVRSQRIAILDFWLDSIRTQKNVN